MSTETFISILLGTLVGLFLRYYRDKRKKKNNIMSKKEFETKIVVYKDIQFKALKETDITWMITNIRTGQALAKYYIDGTVSIIYDFITVKDLSRVTRVCRDLDMEFGTGYI